MENKTLQIDLYALTMAQAYFNDGKKDEIVCHDAFFRHNPFKGGYTMSGGVKEIIEYIQNFRIEEPEIEYLRSLKLFTEDFLSYLKNLKFTGNIYAMPDGTPTFPNEPVITVEAPIIEAQIIEAPILSRFNFGSLICTAAKRITNASVIKTDELTKELGVMEFGLRRSQGDAATDAARYAYIAGCVGTSNVYAGMKHGIPAMGTMAHSMVMEADCEYDAFLSFAKANPENSLFLVDTYDTLRSGIPNAIMVAIDYLVPNELPFIGVRIDSGDLEYLSKEGRKMLDAAGFPNAKIVLSNTLDEYKISDYIREGACIDSIGAGDNIDAPLDRVGGVYKLSAVKKNGVYVPKIKVSGDSEKATTPGYKKPYRIYSKETGMAIADLVALYDEEIPTDEYTLIDPVDEWKTSTIRNYVVKPLQVPIYTNGKLVYKVPTILESRKYCAREFATIYPERKKLFDADKNPHWVDLTLKLLTLKKELLVKYKNNIQVGPIKKKTL